MIVVTWQGPPGAIDLGMIDGAMERLTADPDAEVRHSAICGLGVIGPRISDEAPPDSCWPWRTSRRGTAWRPPST